MSWELASFALIALALGGGFAWYERSHPSSRVLALVATLAALATLGRLAFAPLPNVKPAIDIAFFAGYALGGAPGFAVGAIAALTSNFFLGQGPWTPWQMAAWGATGLLGALLARVGRGDPGRLSLAFWCGIAGYGFGALMDLSQWVLYSGDHTLAKLLVIEGADVPWNAALAIGNLTFALAFGPALIRSLQRFRARFEIVWQPAAAASLALLALAGGIALGGVRSAAAAGSPVAYLRAAQNSDGGFGADRGQPSAGAYTSWAALGLAAAGINPLDVRAHGHTPLDAIAAQVRGADIGALERTILVVRAAGANPRAFAGRDLVAVLERHQRRDGSLAGQVNLTAFAVLALRAAGEPAGSARVAGAARWIARHEDRDGGFNFAGAGASDIDDTGAALQALAAAGRPRSTLARALRFLLHRQNRDGGFPLQPGEASNAQSTAWAIQGLLAAGHEPASAHWHGAPSPFAYLAALQQADGSIRYSRDSAQTPVWVTGQALVALRRATFPLAPVPRARRASRAATARAVAKRIRAARRRGHQRSHRRAAAAAGAPAALAPLAREAGALTAIVLALAGIEG
jgi:energy-coupling factor transport system substrate-specific component